MRKNEKWHERRKKNQVERVELSSFTSASLPLSFPFFSFFSCRSFPSSACFPSLISLESVGVSPGRMRRGCQRDCERSRDDAVRVHARRGAAAPPDSARSRDREDSHDTMSHSRYDRDMNPETKRNDAKERNRQERKEGS